MTAEKQILFEKEELGKIINRMAHEVIEKTASATDIVLIGIRSRGVHLARRIARKIHEITGIHTPVGIVDITSYRDDRTWGGLGPKAPPFEIPVSIDDKCVVLVDDVIFRGRTIRAAMEAVSALGQPKKVLVAALVDRGARELPIRADIVGKNVDAGEGERINVMLEESDGVDRITRSGWPAHFAGQ
jgi:pyrimidine operon attenuation protein / uracil phosphoribosyltransferase